MGFLTGTINDTPDLEKEVHICDQFFVTIRWLSPKQREEILKNCTEYRRGVPDINREKHARAYTRRAVRNWRGLTVETLQGPLRVALYETAITQLRQVAADNKGELPFNAEDSVLLYLNALPEKYANRIKEAMDEWDDGDVAAEEAITKK